MKTIDIRSHFNMHLDPRDRNDNSEPKSRTFNEDEESWEKKNDDETENQGTSGNDWDANNPVERSNDHRYDDEQRDAGDYISSDHSEYNRGNSRFGWYDSEEY